MKRINIGPTNASDYFGAHVIPANTRFLNLSNYEKRDQLGQGALGHRRVALVRPLSRCRSQRSAGGYQGIR